jgi:hypothetical protein
MTKKKKPIFGPDVSGPESEIEDKVEEPLIVPPPEKKAVDTATKLKPQPSQDQEMIPSIPVGVFVRICGQKFDKMAGFRRWAVDRGLKRLSVKDWRQEYEKFLRLPVA